MSGLAALLSRFVAAMGGGPAAGGILVVGVVAGGILGAAAGGAGVRGFREHAPLKWACRGWVLEVLNLLVVCCG